MNCARESRNPFTPNIKHFLVKKTGKALTGNTVNNFHLELYLTYILYQNQNKLTAHLLIFNQVTFQSRKKRPKTKLQRLRNIRIWTFASLLHQIISF